MDKVAVDIVFAHRSVT